jgi:hypothetical protein
MARITSVSVDFDNCLSIVAEGRVYRQERIGNKRPWKLVSLDGLAPKAVKSLCHRADGTLYAICTDGSLFIHEAVGGTRYNVDRKWSPVEFVEPADDAASSP